MEEKPNDAQPDVSGTPESVSPELVSIEARRRWKWRATLGFLLGALLAVRYVMRRWEIRASVMQWAFLVAFLSAGLVAVVHGVKIRGKYANRVQRSLDIALHSAAVVSGLIYVAEMYAHGRTTLSVSLFVLFVLLVIVRIAWAPSRISPNVLAETFE